MKKIQSISVLALIIAVCLLCLASCESELHFDFNKDGICDLCKAELNGTPACTEHEDTDNDNKCDKCGADVVAHEPPECEEHIDADGNGKCDKCDADVQVTPSEYTVTFDFNNEAVADIVLSIRPKKVVPGEAVAEPEVNFTAENPDNWKVIGWYLDAACTEGNEWDFDIDTVDADMTLYAKWESTPLRNVTYMFGYDKSTLAELHSVQVEDGLMASRVDSRISGHEILGYYADEDMTVEYDFSAAVNADTTIYIKISEYLYIGAEELSKFNSHNAAATLAEDKSSVKVIYTLADNYIQSKALNIEMNGYEWIEIVYKAPAGSRIDIFWIGQHSDGSYVDGKSDYNTRTETVGLSSFGCIFEVDEDGYTHMKFQITKTRRHQDYYSGADHMPVIEDLAKIVGFRIDLDGDQGEGVEVEFKYVKAYGEQKKLNRVTYSDGTATVGFENLPEGAAPKGLSAEVGYKYEYYTDAEMTTPYDMSAVVTKAVTVYVKKVEHNVTVTYAGDVNESKTQASGTKFELLSVQPGKAMVYYADAEMTQPYHVEGNVSENVTVYVDVVDLPVADGHLSMNGAAIDSLFTEHGGNTIKATSIEVVDGNYVLTGPNGTFVMLYATEYALGTDNMITIVYKGTLAGVYYVDNTFAWSSLNAHIKTVSLEDDWKAAQIDLTAAGKDGTFKGLRFDTNGSITVKSIYSMVKPTTATVTYAGGYTGTEEVTLGKTISGSGVFGKQVLGYYLDADYTIAFDPATPINDNITIYVKTSDYFYLGGETLAMINSDGGIVPELVDGKVVMDGISAASYMGLNNITNLYVGGVNKFYVRVKFDNIENVKNVWLFLIGNSPDSTTEDLKDKTSYANIEGSLTFATPDADGYYLLEFDMSADNKLGSEGIDKIRRIRIWVTPMSGKTVTATFDYIASADLTPKSEQPEEPAQPATPEHGGMYFTGADFASNTYDANLGTSSVVSGTSLVVTNIKPEGNHFRIKKAGLAIDVEETYTFTVRIKCDPSTLKEIELFTSVVLSDGGTWVEKSKTIAAADFGTPDADGYYTLTFDFSYRGTKPVTQVTMLRMDVRGNSADAPATVVLDYIISNK